MAQRGILAGATWSAINAAFGVVLPFGIFILFARLLPPAEIGLVALAVAGAEILRSLGLPGLYEALLQQREDRERHHETALFALLIAGLVLSGAYLLLLQCLAARLPGAADHLWLLRLIGLKILLELPALQPQARLAERLAFRRMALRSVAANAVAGTAGVGLAVLADPLAGLVAYQVGLSAVLLLATGLGGGLFARPRPHAGCFRRLLREAAPATGVRLIGATNNQLDQIVVGTALGSGPAAFYNLAKRVETSLMTAASSFSAILFQPVFAAAGPREHGPAAARSLAVLTLTCGFGVAVLLTDGERLVGLAFGARWVPASAALALLAVGGLARSWGTVHGALLSVSGRNRHLLLISGSSAAIGVGLMFGCAPLGVTAVAAAMMLRSVATAACMAAATRGQLPRLGRTYLLEALLPFAAMLAGGTAARLLAERMAGAAGRDLVVIVAAALGCALGGGLWFATRHSGTLLPRLRRAPA